jgi:hypothetical protein
MKTSRPPIIQELYVDELHQEIDALIDKKKNRPVRPYDFMS